MPKPTRPNRNAPSAREPLPGFHRGLESLASVKRELHRRERPSERVADFFTALGGSMPFVYVHALGFALWMAWNMDLVPGLRPFDPFPFGLLTLLVSLEAIFLSAFVLISQNRQQKVDQVRDEIATQINLYQEQELTQVLRIVHRIEKHLGLKDEDEDHVKAMERFVDSDDLFHHIEQVVTERQ